MRIKLNRAVLATCGVAGLAGASVTLASASGPPEDTGAIAGVVQRALAFELGASPDAVESGHVVAPPPDDSASHDIPPQATAAQVSAFQKREAGLAQALFHGAAADHASWVADRLVEGAQSPTLRHVGAGLSAFTVESVTDNGDGSAGLVATAEEWDAAWAYSPDTNQWLYSAPVNDVSVHAELVRDANGRWQVVKLDRQFVNGSP